MILPETILQLHSGVNVPRTKEGVHTLTFPKDANYTVLSWRPKSRMS